jgi:hypothetical protein
VKNLGDKVHKVMRISGVNQIAEAISKKTGKDCGCAERQAKLNRWSNNIVNKILSTKK